jgi:hypothetical protein
VLIGIFLVLLDLAAVALLAIAVVVTALRLRPSRATRPRLAIIKIWTGLIALLAALGLLVLGNARLLISSYDEGRPAAAQFVGTWTDGAGSTLHVLPDGTFTASRLPADADDPAGDGKPHPADGHGTWQIIRGDGTWDPIFTLSGGSQFKLDSWSPASPGEPASVTFAYVFTPYNTVNLWIFSRE